MGILYLLFVSIAVAILFKTLRKGYLFSNELSGGRLGGIVIIL